MVMNCQDAVSNIRPTAIILSSYSLKKKILPWKFHLSKIYEAKGSGLLLLRIEEVDFYIIMAPQVK